MLCHFTRVLRRDPLTGLLFPQIRLPGSGRKIIAVEEKRPHVSHEHMSFK
jgi:hypothetical protein